MNPADLKVGDLLLVRATGWVGRLIHWGQWTGKAREAIEYSHTAIVYSVGAGIVAEMNPPRSKKILLSKLNCAIIDAFRLNRGPVNVDRLQAVVDRRLGEPYGFGKYLIYIPAGLLARVGLVRASHWLSEQAGGSEDVCSAWAIECLAEASGVNSLLRHPCRPADIPLFPELSRVT